jgi:hypothetical protein
MADPVDDLYFPATHDMHGPPFGPVDPRLQVQAAKDEAPADELEFAGQARHIVDDPVEYVPAPQSMQMTDPVVLEFVGQAMHVVFAEAPTAVEYVPAPQSVQRADPGDPLYFPATHVKQGPPFGPEDPMLQMQEDKAKLPSKDRELSGHAKREPNNPEHKYPVEVEPPSTLNASCDDTTPALIATLPPPPPPDPPSDAPPLARTVPDPLTFRASIRILPPDPPPPDP